MKYRFLELQAFLILFFSGLLQYISVRLGSEAVFCISEAMALEEVDSRYEIWRQKQSLNWSQKVII